MEEVLENISPILPLEFFKVAVDLSFIEIEKIKSPLKKTYLLPSFAPFLSEKAFAEMWMGWSEAGLVFDVEVNKPFEECFFPQYRRGDSIELFIDTRDLKTAGFITSFCHHFVILPKPIEEVCAQEVTVFRAEERHELCDPKSLFVQPSFSKNAYSLKIFIPSECLHGYDPTSFDRLGFSYRINAIGEKPQHFVVSSTCHLIESQPSLWSSMHLRKV